MSAYNASKRVLILLFAFAAGCKKGEGSNLPFQVTGFASVYAKPLGRPLVDTFITEVSQDTWIHFPWDTALSYQPPIRDGGV